MQEVKSWHLFGIFIPGGIFLKNWVLEISQLSILKRGKIFGFFRNTPSKRFLATEIIIG